MSEPPSNRELLVERSGAIAIITMNRPEKLNAMARSFWGAMRDTIGTIESDASIRAVILTGAGARAFSAGGDIRALDGLGDLVDRRAFQREAMATFMALEQAQVPVIAAVNGIALGGGCEVTLACDFVVASETASFGMPEARLGLVPGYGILRAPDRIGRAMTKYLVMTGRTIDAHTALRIGLVQQIVPASDLMATALQLAGDIAKCSPLALDVGKRIIDRDIQRSDFDYSVEALALLQSAPDVREGMRAFLDKRSPHFPDKSA